MMGGEHVHVPVHVSVVPLETFRERGDTLGRLVHDGAQYLKPAVCEKTVDVRDARERPDGFVGDAVAGCVATRSVEHRVDVLDRNPQCLRKRHVRRKLV